MYYACRTITHVAACQVDIAFVVDCSGSIRKANRGNVDNWQYIIQFIVDVINNINLQETNVAAVSFGTQLQRFLQLHAVTVWYKSILSKCQSNTDHLNAAFVLGHSMNYATLQRFRC